MMRWHNSKPLNPNHWALLQARDVFVTTDYGDRYWTTEALYQHWQSMKVKHRTIRGWHADALRLADYRVRREHGGSDV